MKRARQNRYFFVATVVAVSALLTACPQPFDRDTIAPGPVTDLNATAEDSRVILTWIDPSDADLGTIEIGAWEVAE